MTLCGADHPYAGRPCTRPAGHDGGHGNADRAWLAEPRKPPVLTEEAGRG